MNSRTDIQAAVKARLAKRYRAEGRFRLFGILAIMAAIAVLILLIGSIASHSILIGKKKGPKLAPFIMTVGQEKVAELLEKAL